MFASTVPPMATRTPKVWTMARPMHRSSSSKASTMALAIGLKRSMHACWRSRHWQRAQKMLGQWLVNKEREKQPGTYMAAKRKQYAISILEKITYINSKKILFSLPLFGLLSCAIATVIARYLSSHFSNICLFFVIFQWKSLLLDVQWQRIFPCTANIGLESSGILFHFMQRRYILAMCVLRRCFKLFRDVIF